MQFPETNFGPTYAERLLAVQNLPRYLALLHNLRRRCGDAADDEFYEEELKIQAFARLEREWREEGGQRED